MSVLDRSPTFQRPSLPPSSGEYYDDENAGRSICRFFICLNRIKKTMRNLGRGSCTQLSIRRYFCNAELVQTMSFVFKNFVFIIVM
jgi:hypothetical protein